MENTAYLAKWYDDIAPTTSAFPKGGKYTESQVVVLTADEKAKTYYTLDGTIPTTQSEEFAGPITISKNSILLFFSVDQNGNAEPTKLEAYSILPVQISDPITTNPIPFQPISNDQPALSTKELELKNIALNQTYLNNNNDIELSFLKLPKRNVINKYYFRLTRNNENFLASFNKTNSYKGYGRLLSNLGTVRRDYVRNLNKRIRLKISIHYSKEKLIKNKVKEKDLRLFIKDRNNNWRGPYTIYQNTVNHTIKFKIRNYLIKKSKAINQNLEANQENNVNFVEKSSKNRTFSPTFYFRTIKDIKFVLADKDALKK